MQINSICILQIKVTISITYFLSFYEHTTTQEYKN